MRKILSIIILATTLLGLLAGCRKEPEPPEAPAAPAGSGVPYERVLDNFEKVLTEADLAEYYTVNRLPLTYLPESGGTYQAIVVTDSLRGGTSHRIGLYADPAGEVSAAVLNAEDEIGLALFCYYLVEALEIPDISILDLSDNLDLLSSEPFGIMRAAGWLIAVTSLDDSIVFRAVWSPE